MDNLSYPLEGIKFRVYPGKNDLRSTAPDLAAEFHPTRNHPFTPDTVTRSSANVIWWLGACGHEWYASLNRRAQGQGCLVCSNKNKQIMSGVNDFASQNSELMAEWNWERNTLDPTLISSNYSKRVWWTAGCGHEWDMSLQHRRQGAGCPYCANQRVLKGYNDFASSNPHLVDQWSPRNELRPDQVVSGSNKPVEWICSNGHVWKTTPGARSKGLGCAICSRKRFVPGQNDLELLFPEIAAEWHPTRNGDLKPNQVAPTIGSYWWICKRDHEWKASANNRTTHGKGCRRCALAYSKFEDLFGDYLRSIYSGEIKTNQRVLMPPTATSGRNKLELDFILPELKLAFEIQDFATHSLIEGEAGSWQGKAIVKKGPAYHEMKRRLAEEQLGLKLIDIWENELMDGSFKGRVAQLVSEAQISDSMTK